MRIPLGNAIPGPLRFANAPYQIDPLDAMDDPTVERVTLMWGAQLGKTLLINAAIGYYIAHEPHSQMMMQPSQGDLHTWLETKFNPMVEANPTLLDRIAKPRSREGVNNQAMKSYPGGFLMFSWAGSPRTMRGRSAPKIYCDEVDGYEYTAEGHPVNLLWQRAATFGDQRKLLVTSTPTVKGVSFVEASFEDGDQRRFFLPCTHCGEYQTLKWSNVQWERNENNEHLPETAVYVCEHCGVALTDADKRVMLRHGEWRATKPFRGHASFHLNELYSSFRRFQDIVRSFLEKKANNDVQSFINVSLAETWEEHGEQADPQGLATFAENYDEEYLPDGVKVVTCGVDTQSDRLEAQIIGWKAPGVPYIINQYILWGDPAGQKVWGELDKILTKRYGKLPVAQTFIDSGGQHTEYVYAYTKKRHGRRVFPCKGDGGQREPVSRAKQTSAQRAMLVKVGVDTLKRTLLHWLKTPGDAIHFSRLLDSEFYNQLTAEKMVLRKVKGFSKVEFVKTRDRNEALDCFIYGYAAMLALNIKWGSLPAERPIPEEPEPAEEEQIVTTRTEKPTIAYRPPPPRRQRSGFVKRF
jgi:phage terminase large subunit GpA-like protein